MLDLPKDDHDARWETQAAEKGMHGHDSGEGTPITQAGEDWRCSVVQSLRGAYKNEDKGVKISMLGETSSDFLRQLPKSMLDNGGCTPIRPERISCVLEQDATERRHRQRSEVAEGGTMVKLHRGKADGFYSREFAG